MNKRDFFNLEAVIYKLTCPCGEINYVRDEHFEDSSELDPETIKCWKCGNVYWISESTKVFHYVIDRKEPELSNEHPDQEGLKNPDMEKF